MNLYKMIMGCAIFVSANLSALCLTNNVEFSFGYRQDDVKTGVDTFLEILGGDQFIDNDFKLKHVDIWQVGGKFRLFFPGLYCRNDNYGCGCLDLDLLRNFYLKGHGYWGETCGHNRYSNSFFSTETDQFAFGFGTIKGYNTYDWQIGLGYLFDLGCLFYSWPDLELGIGILGGYSWNKNKFKVDKAYFANESELTLDEAFAGTHFSNRWQGGWIGTELYYATCDFLFNLGYEYHWSNWRSTFNINELGPEALSSDRRTSDHAHGNVVYLDTTYYICDCWDLGLGFKYAYFTAEKGKVKQFPERDEPAFDGRGTWRTWQLTANIGYNW